MLSLAKVRPHGQTRFFDDISIRIVYRLQPEHFPPESEERLHTCAIITHLSQLEGSATREGAPELHRG
jgi:hypothetical protein